MINTWFSMFDTAALFEETSRILLSGSFGNIDAGVIIRRDETGKIAEVRAIGPEGKPTNDLVVLG